MSLSTSNDSIKINPSQVYPVTWLLVCSRSSQDDKNSHHIHNYVTFKCQDNWNINKIGYIFNSDSILKLYISM